MLAASAVVGSGRGGSCCNQPLHKPCVLTPTLSKEMGFARQGRHVSSVPALPSIFPALRKQTPEQILPPCQTGLPGTVLLFALCCSRSDVPRHQGESDTELDRPGAAGGGVLGGDELEGSKEGIIIHPAEGKRCGVDMTRGSCSQRFPLPLTSPDI